MLFVRTSVINSIAGLAFSFVQVSFIKFSFQSKCFCMLFVLALFEGTVLFEPAVMLLIAAADPLTHPAVDDL